MKKMRTAWKEIKSESVKTCVGSNLVRYRKKNRERG